MTSEDQYEPITPLPYSRHEPWTLAPWLTGIIVALVIFVILIPALCSACYHYYSYKLGLDEDIDQEEYLDDEDDYEDDEEEDEEEEDDEEESCSEEEEEEEDEEGEEEDGPAFRKAVPGPLHFPPGYKGSIITCCPRLFMPGSVMPSCQLDADLPRLPCGHLGVPTRDVAIQVPLAFPVENIYDDTGPSSTPSTTAEEVRGGEESDATSPMAFSAAPPRTTMVTWKKLLSPSTESSSSAIIYNNERPSQELLIGGGGFRSKCLRCGGYETPRHHGGLHEEEVVVRGCQHFRHEMFVVEDLIPPLPKELLRPRRGSSFGHIHF